MMPHPNTQRVACYVRVSTHEQNCELQRREIAEYIEKRGWSQPIFFEDKATGTTENRPMLKEMLTQARKRKIDVIICWKMDRLFRSLKHLILTLQEFSELGISFLSLRDQIDLSTSAGRLMLHIVGAFAEFESSLIQERVKAGLANARAKGRILGRPKKRDDVIILRLRKQGVSIRGIAKHLNISKGSVQRALVV